MGWFILSILEALRESFGRYFNWEDDPETFWAYDGAMTQFTINCWLT